MPRRTLKVMSRWATAIVALLLVSAMASSTLLGCLAVPAAAPQMQMACCGEQPGHCPMHRAESQTAADCCRHDSHRQRELTTAEVQPLHAPVAALQPLATAVVVVLSPPPFDGYVRVSHHSGSPPSAPSSLSTVLLI